jgi:hypothetical protein
MQTQPVIEDVPEEETAASTLDCTPSPRSLVSEEDKDPEKEEELPKEEPQKKRTKAPIHEKSKIKLPELKAKPKVHTRRMSKTQPVGTRSKVRPHPKSNEIKRTAYFIMASFVVSLVVGLLLGLSGGNKNEEQTARTPIFSLLESDMFPKSEPVTHEERAQRTAGAYDAERIRLQLEMYMKKNELNYLCMHHLELKKPIKQLCAVQFDPPCSSVSLVDYVSIVKYAGRRLNVVETSTLRPGKASEGVRNDRVFVRWRDYETGELMESYLKQDLSFVFQRIFDEFQGIPIV